jgi:hypothetical protein
VKELISGKLREVVRWKLVESPQSPWRAVVGDSISGLHPGVKVGGFLGCLEVGGGSGGTP